MGFIIAGILAAVVAFAMNRIIFKVVGRRGIFLLTPVVEEILKTGLAIVFAASIVKTHGVFGLIEGIYDFLAAGKGAAGLVSIASHLLFGAVTYLVSSSLGLVVAVLVSTILHAGWNALIVKLAGSYQP